MFLNGSSCYHCVLGGITTLEHSYLIPVGHIERRVAISDMGLFDEVVGSAFDIDIGDREQPRVLNGVSFESFTVYEVGDVLNGCGFLQSSGSQ